MTRWSTYVALLLGALVLSTQAGAQTESPEQGRILGERAQAGADLWPQVERARARSELEAVLTARGRALNEALAASRPAGDGAGAEFDWVAAGGGAGATLLLVLGALTTVFLVRRSRRAVTEAA